MRPPRIDIPDYPFHIFVRGNNQQNIFLTNKDRSTYLKIIRQAKSLFNYSLYTFALMDNHIHLLLQMNGQSSLSKFMHRIQTAFSHYFNSAHQRKGHVFESRFNSNIVDTDRYFVTVERYIHLNPVRAGMVSKPEDYLWSSYAHRFSGRFANYIDHNTPLEYFGQSRRQQLKEYQIFTELAMSHDEEWTHDELLKIRYIGSADFVKRVQACQAMARVG
jgi:putative transposase